LLDTVILQACVTPQKQFIYLLESVN